MPILIKGSGGKKAKLQAKPATPTKSTQTITPDSGFDGLSQCTVYPIPSSYVSPSYTQSPKTWTPGTSNQYISSGTYCSGLQTIKGDSNLVASNIKSGVSIFGVTGNMSDFICERPMQSLSTNSIKFDEITYTAMPKKIYLFCFNPIDTTSGKYIMSLFLQDNGYSNGDYTGWGLVQNNNSGAQQSINVEGDNPFTLILKSGYLLLYTPSTSDYLFYGDIQNDYMALVEV